MCGCGNDLWEVKPNIFITFDGKYWIIDRTPKTIKEHLLRIVNRMHQIEMVLQLIEHPFHFSNPFLKKHCSVSFYSKLSHIHHGSHAIEDLFHPLAFFADLVKWWNGSLISYYHTHTEKTSVEKVEKIDTFRTAAKVLIMGSHFLNTFQALNRSIKTPFAFGGKLKSYAAILEALGTFSSLASLYMRSNNKKITGDILMNGGSLLYQISSLPNLKLMNPVLFDLVSKISCLGGLLNALIAYNLSFPDVEKIKKKNIIPPQTIEGQEVREPAGTPEKTVANHT